MTKYILLLEINVYRTPIEIHIPAILENMKWKPIAKTMF